MKKALALMIVINLISPCMLYSVSSVDKPVLIIGADTLKEGEVIIGIGSGSPYGSSFPLYIGVSDKITIQTGILGFFVAELISLKIKLFNGFPMISLLGTHLNILDETGAGIIETLLSFPIGKRSAFHTSVGYAIFWGDLEKQVPDYTDNPDDYIIVGGSCGFHMFVTDYILLGISYETSEVNENYSVMMDINISEKNLISFKYKVNPKLSGTDSEIRTSVGLIWRVGGEYEQEVK